MSEKQLKNGVSQEDITKKLKELKKPAMLSLNKKQNLTKADYMNIQNYILLLLMSGQGGLPPDAVLTIRLSSWTTLQIKITTWKVSSLYLIPLRLQNQQDSRKLSSVTHKESYKQMESSKSNILSLF